MDIYREEILEHWQNPQNFGVMDKPDVVVKQVNPLCGDEITMQVKLNGSTIDDIRFTGRGCAISMASASMLSEFVKGKKKQFIAKITGKDVLKLIGGPSTHSINSGRASSGFPPARLKCALLALEAVRAVNGKL